MSLQSVSVVGPAEYAKPPRTYNVDPNTQLTTIVPIQSVTGSVSGTTDVWFQLAYASEATYLSLFPPFLPLSLFPSPLSYICRTDVSVDKSRYKFTQNGATATNKTLATAVKNMFHDKGYKYPAFSASFFSSFFGFILNFDIFVDIFSSKSTRGCQPSHSLCPRSCGSACTKPTIVLSSTHVFPHLLHLLSHPNLTNSLYLQPCFHLFQKCIYQQRYHDNFKHSSKGRVWNQLSPARRV